MSAGGLGGRREEERLGGGCRESGGRREQTPVPSARPRAGYLPFKKDVHKRYPGGQWGDGGRGERREGERGCSLSLCIESSVRMKGGGWAAGNAGEGRRRGPSGRFCPTVRPIPDFGTFPYSSFSLTRTPATSTFNLSSCRSLSRARTRATAAFLQQRALPCPTSSILLSSPSAHPRNENSTSPNQIPFVTVCPHALKPLCKRTPKTVRSKSKKGGGTMVP